MLRRFVIIAIILLVALLTYYSVNWIINNIESYEQLENSGLSARARRNNLLAAEYFLKKSGIPVESVTGRSILYQLPSSRDTLLVADMGIQLSEKRREALQNWLNEGGHLITTVNKNRGSGGIDILQEMFSIQAEVKQLDWRESSKDKTDTLLKVFFKGEKKPLSVSINPRFSLKFDEQFYSDATIIRNDEDIHLLQIEVGDGLLSVISDLEFLNNKTIDKNDHAFMLWMLVNETRKVWLLYSNNSPSLWQKAWQYNSNLFLSIIFLCLIYFWFLWHRFGPVIKSPELSRRNIMEQLSAVGRFHMKTDRAQNLLQNNRKHIRQALQKKHPALRKLNDSEQFEWLAKQMGLDPAIIKQAFNDSPDSDIKLLQITCSLNNIQKFNG